MFVGLASRRRRRGYSPLSINRLCELSDANTKIRADQNTSSDSIR